MNNLLDSIEIKTVEQCTADPFKIKVVAQADRSIGDFLPYLLALDPRATYSEGGGYIAFKAGQGNVTIYVSGRVTATMLQNEEAARALLDDLRGKINDLHRRRETLDLAKLLDRGTLSILGVLKLLPRTNCQRCGEPTCMAFAVRMVSGEARTRNCVPIYEEETLLGKRTALEELLRAAGYAHLAE